jgi:hypothetical protein
MTGAVDQTIIAVGNHLLEEVQLKNECSPAAVINIVVLDPVPGVVSVGGHCFSELGAEYGESVGYVVTLLVKGGCFEPVL